MTLVSDTGPPRQEIPPDITVQLEKDLKNIAKFVSLHTTTSQHQQLQCNPFALGSQNWNVPNIPTNQRINSTNSNSLQL